MKTVKINRGKFTDDQQLAQTISAHLTGPNRFAAFTHDGEKWVLSPCNDIWLWPERGELACRYEYDLPVIQALAALFEARYSK